MFRPRNFSQSQYVDGLAHPRFLDYDVDMTYIADLDPDSTVNMDVWARLDHADATIPGWFEREQAGDRFLDSRDFPLWDEAANARELDIESHEAMAEALYSDPMERHY